MGVQQRKVFLFKDLEGTTSPAPRESSSRASPAVSTRGVVKVPSLLFDIELEDTVIEEKLVDEDLEESLRQLRALITPWTLIEQQLRRQTHEAYADSIREGVKMDAHFLAKKLHLPGYTFKMRSALGGTDGGSCLQQLRHFFLTCSASGGPGSVTYVIDPCFREQFEIANPTPQYTAVLAEVPREFVGTEDCVSQLVTFLSLQLKRSFQVTGSTLPPWRHANSMLSKWRPLRLHDTPVHNGPSFPRTVSNPKDSLRHTREEEKPDTSTEKGSESNAKPAKDLDSSSARPGPTGLAVDHSTGGKRGRAFTNSSNCASLLAVKLRGVDAHFSPQQRYQPLYPGRSKA